MKKIKLCSLIPKYIPNFIVIWLFELFSRIQRFFPKEDHRLYNNRNIGENNRGYIEKQQMLTMLKYGRVTVAYAGCEVIALYNALYKLGEYRLLNFGALLYEMERDGIVLQGYWGTSPYALVRYCKRHNLSYDFGWKQNQFDKIQAQYASMILTFYNNREDIRQQIHTVCITKDKEQMFIHNLRGDGTKEGPYLNFKTLLKEMNGGNIKAICLLGIEKGKAKQ